MSLNFFSEYVTRTKKRIVVMSHQTDIKVSKIQGNNYGNRQSSMAEVKSSCSGNTVKWRTMCCKFVVSIIDYMLAFIRYTVYTQYIAKKWKDEVHFYGVYLLWDTNVFVHQTLYQVLNTILIVFILHNVKLLLRL